MTVTVVICAYTLERWDALGRAVASCASQTTPPDEVVVVIDHNDELLARAAAELKNVRVLPNRSTKGLSGARNTGVAGSVGDVVAFLDDDAYADPDWLDALLGPFADPTVAGVGGWIVPDWQGTPAEWFPETYYWILGCSYSGLPPTGATLRNPIGANMALRRRVFDEVGGFTSGIGRIGKVPLGCEETELCIRFTANHPDDRFVLERRAVVHHLVPPSRLTWSYFRSRCWAEGLSKAAVSSLVGSRSGLASERTHVLKAMPKELAASLGGVVRRPGASTAKVALIVSGAAVAAAGLVRGRMALRRSPLEGGGELEPLPPDAGESDGMWPSPARPAG
jgi:cellulose synthase/poly-beta-1,6-N-acetylglucosamine synthase-like glycosyltransferase